MFGELNQNQIEELLHTQIIGRIGCHADGETYIVPISYVYDGESLFAHTLEGMKIRMMRKNPEVCFEVDAIQHAGSWQSVICSGHFEELINAGDRRNALEKLHEKVLPFAASATARLSPEYPYLTKDISEIKGIVFRIQIVKKSGKFENNATPSFLEWS